MWISELNTKELTDPAYVAFDDGTDTYKTEFNECVENAANAAVAAADLTENEVAFTSGDAASPTAWSSVSVLTSGSTLATLFNRISTMIKNVRWLYSKLGTTDISSIGNGTVTGALSTLNGNTNAAIVTVQKQSSAITISANGTATYNIDITKTGYTPIGIIQLQNNSGTYVMISGYWMNANKTTLSIYMRSFFSSELSVYAIVTIAYVKNAFV